MENQATQARECHADDYGNLITTWVRSDDSFTAMARFIFDGMVDVSDEVLRVFHLA